MSRRKFSAVWLYFEEEDGKKARCKFCNKSISYLGGSQGNLNRHMKLKHATTVVTYDEVAQATGNLIKQELNVTQPSLSPPKAKKTKVSPRKAKSPEPDNVIEEPEEIASVSKFANVSKTESSIAVSSLSAKCTEVPVAPEEIDRQVLRMIKKGQHSFRIVEEPAFRELIEEVSKVAGYALPTRKRLTSVLLPKVHKELLKGVKEQIQHATDVCLTFDKWKSRTNDCYAALTAHYINPDTELVSSLLACHELKNGHTAQSYYNFLKDVISDYNINNKITVIVSDNTPDIADAISQGDWLGITCFAHCLNSTVENALQTINDTTNKVRKIAEYFSENLQELNELISLPGIKLEQDDPSRWTSTYEMLENVNQIQDAVILTISSNNPDLTLLSQDWEIIAETLPILKPFYEVVADITGEKSLCLSKVTVLCNILETYVSQNFPINEVVGAMLSNLQLGLFSCFGSVEKEYLYAESALLDPRFKRRGFRNEESFKQAVKNLNNKISSITLPGDKEESFYRTSSGVRVRNVSLWSDYDMEFKKTAKFNSEFEKYLNEEYLDRKMDPFVWWKQRKSIYPRVYMYALKRLCIVATAVPCERIFSATGQILTEKRTLLKPKTVEGLVFLHNNM